MVSKETQMMIYLVILLNTFAFPSLLIFFLLKRKVISSLSLQKLEERKLPFIVAAIFFYFTYYLLSMLALPKIISIMILGATVAVCFSILINLYFKLSIHMVGISGLIGGFLAFAFRYDASILAILSILSFVAGIIAFARLELQAHSNSELFIGAVLGFVCMLITVSVGIA